MTQSGELPRPPPALRASVELPRLKPWKSALTPVLSTDEQGEHLHLHLASSRSGHAHRCVPVAPALDGTELLPVNILRRIAVGIVLVPAF